MAAKPKLYLIVRYPSGGHSRAFLTDDAAAEVMASGISEEAFNTMGVDVSEVASAGLTDERRAYLTALSKRMAAKLGAPEWISAGTEAVVAYQSALKDPRRRLVQRQYGCGALKVSAIAPTRTFAAMSCCVIPAVRRNLSIKVMMPISAGTNTPAYRPACGARRPYRSCMRARGSPTRGGCTPVRR